MGRVCGCVGWVRKAVCGSWRFEGIAIGMNCGVPARVKERENPIGQEHVRRLTPNVLVTSIGLGDRPTPAKF